MSIIGNPFYWVIIFLSLITPHLGHASQNDQSNKNENIDQKWDDLKNKFVNTAQNASDGASGFLNGIGQSVGIVTADYHYSFQVWNDTANAVLAATQRIVPAMGMSISEDYDYAQIVEPFTNSGQSFVNQQLYFSVALFADPKNSFAQLLGKASVQDLQKVAGASAQYQILSRDIYPWPKDDNNMYFYRVYRAKTNFAAEYLGIKTATTDFLGMFYNNSAKDVTLEFVKDSQDYKITLEAGTFNSLQSTSTNFPFSIRPQPGKKAAFNFSAGNNPFATMPIAQQGIGNVSYNETTKTYDPAGPMLYTYEVYSKDSGALDVTIQGLSIGNFDQPISGKLRDINPVQCHVWRQSAQQAQIERTKAATKESTDDTTSIAYDAPETFWVAYKTQDYSIAKKVEAGKVLDFTIIRPQIKEKEAWLYGVTLLTNDDTKAKKFLDRLSEGKIGQGAVYTKAGLIGGELDLSKMSANTNGLIADTDPKDGNRSGVIGYVIFADSFLPTGVDSSANFYYFAPPPDLRIDQLLGLIYFSDDSYTKDQNGAIVLKPSIAQAAQKNFLSWLAQYPKNKANVQSEVKKYIQENGNAVLFVNGSGASGERVLTQQGQHMVDMILDGPISIANYPLLRKAGINYYVFTLGGRPDSWPS
ncbi:hypothetical protein HYX58_04155 [Candidatus Dependentiae bacterium]|nr:hypothetical protein [Candidatus Dependentiae bacterium]